MESIQAASERAIRGIALLEILVWIFMALSLVAVAMIAVGFTVVRKGARGPAV
jgi:Tfp pilus assembly protein PilW